MSEPVLIIRVFDDLTFEIDSNDHASELILAGLAAWTMETIIDRSKCERSREHARRVLKEIWGNVYVN